MNRIIAQMVVKDEANRYLEEVLVHLKTIVDEIVITDDGSTDNTVEICKKYTDNVYENKDSMFSVNESTLRHGAWKNLQTHARKGDWILCIDGDEKLFETRKSLRELIRTTRYDVLGITFVHMWNKTHFRVDKAWAPVVSSRLFRYLPEEEFSDRRMACGSEPLYVRRLISEHRFFPRTGLIMQHLGYARDEDKKAKYDRYMELDKGEFHAKAHLESILDSNVQLRNWDDVLIKRSL